MQDKNLIPEFFKTNHFKYIILMIIGVIFFVIAGNFLSDRIVKKKLEKSHNIESNSSFNLDSQECSVLENLSKETKLNITHKGNCNRCLKRQKDVLKEFKVEINE